MTGDEWLASGMNQLYLEARQNAGPRVFLGLTYLWVRRGGVAVWVYSPRPHALGIQVRTPRPGQSRRVIQAETFRREAPAAGRPSAP